MVDQCEAARPSRARTRQLQDWYSKNAQSFEKSTAIQPNRVFAKLTPEQQLRLDRFKLWFLESPDIVSIVGKNVLEFGCGQGRLALGVEGYETYVGVDFVRQFVEVGTERLRAAGIADRARLEHAACLDFSGPPEAFDVVCALGMFEFVEFPKETIEKMVYHLKPGGKLFIDAHSSSILYNGARRRLHRRIEASGGVPKRLFSAREVRQLFQQSGLTDVRILMKEWPLLGSLYARYGNEILLKFRNWIAPMRWLHLLGTDFVAIGTKPH